MASTSSSSALAGDRLYLALDAPLCRAVSGRDASLVHPNLVCDVAIGQSTGPTQRVRGNLFYRGLVLARPVFVGDTLRTRTELVGLKQNRRREGAPTTGLVALRMTTVDQSRSSARWRGCALSCRRSGAPASGRSCSTGDSWPSWPRKEAE